MLKIMLFQQRNYSCLNLEEAVDHRLFLRSPNQSSLCLFDADAYKSSRREVLAE